MTARRALLKGAVGAATAGGLTVALAGSDAAAAQPSIIQPSTIQPSTIQPSTIESSTMESSTVAFHGIHQAGVTTPPQPRATVLSLDVEATSKAQLEDLLRTITSRARFLTSGGTPGDSGISAPPTDSGVLGPVVPPDRLTITLGVGASLFDHRFGLADRKPAGLTMMPTFPDDHLVAALCHGDLSLQVCAENTDTVGHAVREIARATRGAVSVRWRSDGFKSPPRPSGTPRNLLGFKDGTSNLDTTDAALMNRMVWLSGRDWTGGGTYQVIRSIRMLVEFWDRIGISEQENLIGRRRDTGAPMDGNAETDIPNFGADPIGAATPLTSHIRRANPRSAASDPSRILRRPYNFDRGMDPVGDLDMGLLFISYQASLQRQFEAVQKRLEAEPLTDYIQPTGGGYFMVLPGVRDTRDFFGRTLLA